MAVSRTIWATSRVSDVSARPVRMGPPGVRGRAAGGCHQARVRGEAVSDPGRKWFATCATGRRSPACRALRGRRSGGDGQTATVSAGGVVAGGVVAGGVLASGEQAGEVPGGAVAAV